MSSPYYNRLSAGYGISVTVGLDGRPQINQSNASAGLVRWNCSSKHLEVYDGYNWITIPQPEITVQLDAEVASLLDWIRVQRRREEEIAKLAKEHASVSDALEIRNRAEQQLNILCSLVREYNSDKK